MGGDKTTQQGSSNNESEYSYTPESQLIDRYNAEYVGATQAGRIGASQAGLELIQNILRGQKLPGYFEGLERGISPEITQSIVDKSLQDAAPGYYQSGLQDSGVRASISARTSGDIRRASEEFNIGNKMNLLNLGVGGQAQIIGPTLNASSQVAGRLAGIRQIGNYSGSTIGMNPFWKSFQQGAGTSLGTSAGQWFSPNTWAQGGGYR